MQASFDAVIVGAGPAGTTAAILLARAGWSVALLEREVFPRRKVCGECLSAPSLPLIDALGLGRAFAEKAGPALHRVALWCGEQSASAALPQMPGTDHPWGRALGRDELDSLLLEAARSAGACILQPCAARSLTGSPGDFCCAAIRRDTAAALTLRAPVAIAAQGSGRLRAAQQARGGAGRASDLLAFKANFADARLPHGLLPVLAFHGGYGGVVVAGRDSATLACCIRADRLRALRRASPGDRAGPAVEAYLRRECALLDAVLAGASRVGPWLAVGPIRPQVRIARLGTGAFLVGNAAGEAHPIIGEGIAMAMQSAWLLAAALVRCGREPLRHSDAAAVQRGIQQRYAAAWHACFVSRMRIAALFAQAAMRPALAARFVQLCEAMPAVLTAAARWSGKVAAFRGPPSLERER